MVYSTTNDGSLMYCPRFWAGGLAVKRWRPLWGARCVAVPSQRGGRGEVLPLLGGGLWLSSGGAPYTLQGAPCVSVPLQREVPLVKRKGATKT